MKWTPASSGCLSVEAHPLGARRGANTIYHRLQRRNGAAAYFQGLSRLQEAAVEDAAALACWPQVWEAVGPFGVMACHEGWSFRHAPPCSRQRSRLKIVAVAAHPFFP